MYTFQRFFKDSHGIELNPSPLPAQVISKETRRVSQDFFTMPSLFTVGIELPLYPFGIDIET
jgi:hypothetical protein